MASADQCRQYAAECVRVAQQLRDPTDKAMLLDMAEMWRRLAERAEHDAMADADKDRS